ncbi:MAG: DUF2490 domain-containing protein [Bacteroidales bacterium]|nr:DUF2490 domain-containing protein [Bacteroidales bacterium]
MKKQWFLFYCICSLWCCCCLFPKIASSQTIEKLPPEVGARVSVGIDKKIIKGLHITLEEEARFDNNFKGFDRLQTSLMLKYKVHKNIKLGLGYAFITPYNSDNKSFQNFRHRLMLDITGTLHFGKWNLSLKERFQWTYRAGEINIYQNPRNLLSLKSRLMIRYKGSKVAEPYAYIEIRNLLNAPAVSAYYDGTNYVTEDGYSTDTPGWFISSYRYGYINRLRGALGVDVHIGKHNVLNFSFLADYTNDKTLDANSEGTKLKSFTKERGFVGNFSVGYVFSF